MSMITGVGDEVVEVLGLLVAAAVAALAWWSTAARPDRYRTVIVMERSARATPHNLTLMGRNINTIRRHLMRSNGQAIFTQELITPTELREVDSSGSESQNNTRSAGQEPSISHQSEASVPSEQAREMDSIVEAMDADVSARPQRTSLDKSSGDAAVIVTATENILQKPDDSEATEPRANDGNTTARAETSGDGDTKSRAGTAPSADDAQRIVIKLKYLNDTFREVDGCLDELLKHFKGRHFATEISAQYRVLLIFNGHVLSDDTSTLATCGLYHNCVVHCLVHPPRQTRSAASPAEVVPSLLAQPTPPPPPPPPPADRARAWDLENVLMTLISLILTIIWFFRCEYSNIFTASASGALFALTIFYSVAIFGLYFSDTFHLTDRRTRNQPAAQRAQLVYG